MSKCVGIDGSGFVVELAETFPDCSQFVIVSPGHYERLTFWADLAIELDPAGSTLYTIMAAIMLSYATVWGWKVIVRQIFNR